MTASFFSAQCMAFIVLNKLLFIKLTSGPKFGEGGGGGGEFALATALTCMMQVKFNFFPYSPRNRQSLFRSIYSLIYVRRHDTTGSAKAHTWSMGFLCFIGGGDIYLFQPLFNVHLYFFNYSLFDRKASSLHKTQLRGMRCSMTSKVCFPFNYNKLFSFMRTSRTLELG